MLLSADQHRLLSQLVSAAKLGQTAEQIASEFQRPAGHKQAATVQHLRTLLDRLGTAGPIARQTADALLPLVASSEPHATLCRFLDVYAQSLEAGSARLSSAQQKARKTRESLKAIVNNVIGGAGGGRSSSPSANSSQPSEETTKWSDVKRRVTAAASFGLSKSARNSHMSPATVHSIGNSDADAGTCDKRLQLLPAVHRAGDGYGDDSSPQNVGNDHQQQQQQQHNEDAFALRRRQTLWQCNHAESPLFFQRRCATALPVHNQEQLLIGELLDCLVGIAGTFVRPVERQQQQQQQLTVAFAISDQINCSMRDLAAPLLVMGTHYTIIDDFCVLHGNEYRGFGLTGPHPHRSGDGNSGGSLDVPRGSQVLQALAEAMRSLKQDYMQTIGSLESDAAELTLSKLVHLLRPARRSLSVLAQTVDTVNGGQLRGAAVLTMLHRQIRGALGDEVRQQVLEHLLEQAAVPYVRTLQLWIVNGVVHDPHREFMIEEHEARSGEPAEEETYWGNRYLVRPDRMPEFVADVQAEVQRTGKYLNVMRQCGYTVDGRSCDGDAEETTAASAVAAETATGGGMAGETLRYSATSNEHLVFINKAYCYASHRLLELLVNKNDLMGHLASVRRYLLMQQGDFIEQFMDVVEEELSKNVDLAMPSKLENLLGLVLRTTSAKDDKYIDELRVHIYDCDLQTQMAQIHGCGRPSTASAKGAHADVGAGGDDATGAAAVAAAPLPALNITGFEGFSFDYEVRWPVSLVLNNFSLTFYKSVFRLLFYLKHAQRQLGRMWIHNKNVKRFEARRMSDVQRSTLTLSHRMRHAVQNIEYYMMLEVVDPMWQQFLASMAQVQNVDEVIDAHGKFTAELVEHTMLWQPDLLGTLIALCRMCLEFSGLVMAQTEMRESAEFARKVSDCSGAFTALMLDLLAKLNGNHVGSVSNRYVNLVHRLNFNSFYSDKTESSSKPPATT